MSSKFITLLTDFGTKDPYVAMMKGVIYRINPEVLIIDITHHIPPGAVLAGAFLLRESFSYFPKGTVHVAVVDPGVGTERKAIVIETRDYYFVGPDNGILWPSVEAQGPFQAYALEKKEFFLPKLSSTFHGRDIFAPVAAHLSKGVPLHEIGVPIVEPLRSNIPNPKREQDNLEGEVIWVDRFGNLITNIRVDHLGSAFDKRNLTVEIGGVRIAGLKNTFGDVEKGQFLAYIGSLGYMEIGINSGSAQEALMRQGLESLGAKVRVSLPMDPK